MFDLSNIGPRKGAKKNRRRIGRGAASGWGKTAGKGTKGQKSRSGASIPASFEGGQMPLYRRLPKRGFKNPFRKEYCVVNLHSLQTIKAGTVVDQAFLAEQGLLRKKIGEGVKILGDGDFSVAATFKVAKVSASAKAKIEAAGGTVEIV